MIPLAVLLLLAPGQDTQFKELRRMVPNSVPATFRTNVVDIDGDGSPDLIATASTDARVLLNDGQGVLIELEAGAFPGGCNCNAQSRTFGDLDGDGHLDAIFDGELYFGDGQGSFVKGPSSIVVPAGVRDIAYAIRDRDGDGDMDLILLLRESQVLANFIVAENMGGRVFVRQADRIINISGFFPPQLSLADLDADGDLDVLAINRLDAARILQGDQGQFVYDARPFPGVGQGLIDGEAADLDGDGDADLILRTAIDGLSFYTNDGTGGFTLASRVRSAGNTYRAELVDLENDGDLDVFAYKVNIFAPETGKPILLENKGNLQFEDVSDRLPALPVAAPEGYTGDFNSDGFVDLMLIASRGSSSSYRLLLSDGQGALNDADSHVPLEAGLALVSYLEDLDGDGVADLIGSSTETGLLWINDGHGKMESRSTQLPSEMKGLRDLAIGDADGDGDLDVFLPRSGQSILLINDGSGTFSDETAARLPLDTSATECAEMADLDGDGDLDLILGNTVRNIFTSPLPDPDEIWLNDGNGFFQFFGLLPSLSMTRAIAVADIDSDGDLDLVLGNQGANALFRNDGNAGFEDISENLPGRGARLQSDALAFGDVNGDGAPDLYICFQGMAATPGCFDCVIANLDDGLFINDGTGVFTLTSGLNIGSGIGTGVRFADLDEDGDLDAVLTEFFAGRINVPLPAVSILVNDGQRDLSIQSPALIRKASEGNALAIADIDGDGDMDIVANTRVFTNRARSLARRASPKAGQPLQLEIAGQPGTLFYLGGAVEATSQQHTVFGNLYLPTHNLRFSTHGILDDLGEADLRLPIPAHPALVGRTLYWQALVGDPLRLTNLEPTTFR